MPHEQDSALSFSDWVNDYLDKNPVPTVPPERQLRGQDLSLDEWLTVFLEEPERLNDLSRYDFPTNEHFDEFLQRIDEFPEKLIYQLLFRLLPNTSSFPISDVLVALTTIERVKSGEHLVFEHLEKVNYLRQTLLAYKEQDGRFTIEGCTWVIGLLPDHPSDVLAALRSYGLAHLVFLPDASITAFSAAQKIIRAKFIGIPKSDDEYLALLKNISPRDFEHLVESMYHRMGYQTEITPPSRDGGRDVIARKLNPHESEEIVIECKRYTDKKVGIEIVQRLRGAVDDLRPTRFVIATTSTLAEPALKVIERDPMLNYMDGSLTVKKMTELFGPRWPLEIDRILLQSQKRYESQPAARSATP